MTLINRVAIYSGGSELHLPPYEQEINVYPYIYTIGGYDAPYAGYTHGYSRVHGWDITASGLYIGSTPAVAEAWRDSFHEIVMNASTGEVKDCEACTWADTGGSIKRVYRDCKMTAIEATSQRRLSMIRYSITLRSKTFVTQSTWSSGATPGSGPYESYLYNGTGSAAVPLSLIIPYSAFFSGGLETTTANNTGTMQRKIIVPTGCTKISSIYISGASLLDESGSGNTTIDVSDTDYSTAGNYLRSTLSYNATTTTTSTGTINVTAGNSVYVYVSSSAGSHADVTAIITFES